MNANAAISNCHATPSLPGSGSWKLLRWLLQTPGVCTALSWENSSGAQLLMCFYASGLFGEEGKRRKTYFFSSIVTLTEEFLAEGNAEKMFPLSFPPSPGLLLWESKRRSEEGVLVCTHANVCMLCGPLQPLRLARGGINKGIIRPNGWLVINASQKEGDSCWRGETEEGGTAGQWVLKIPPPNLTSRISNPGEEGRWCIVPALPTITC